jgi:hypothetical protein
MLLPRWDKTRRDLPAGKAVMITDASNAERDQINAMAQERRADAGELGSHRVELPGKPYGLAAGDEVIFSAQFHPFGQKRIENGIAGTVLDADRRRDRVTVETHEREPRGEGRPRSSPTSIWATPSTSTRPRASPPGPRAS